MSVKQYALVSGDHVRYVSLRETAKFLIADENNGDRFKKVDGREYVASNVKFSNWSHRGYEVYEVDHPHVLSIIEKSRQKSFVFHVRRELEKLHMQRDMSFDTAKKINKLLELGIEEK